MDAKTFNTVTQCFVDYFVVPEKTAGVVDMLRKARGVDKTLIKNYEKTIHDMDSVGNYIKNNNQFDRSSYLHFGDLAADFDALHRTIKQHEYDTLKARLQLGAMAGGAGAVGYGAYKAPEYLTRSDNE